MSQPSKLHHVYDGIEEEDNRLPNWWLGILFGTIAFGFAYWFYYEVVRAEPGPAAAYRAEVAARAQHAPALESPLTDATLAALVKDPQSLKAGEVVFQTNCAACHGGQAQGLIGPNLTDKYWLHGGKPTQIHHTIATGVLDKGMPAWERVLGPERLRAVTAFILSQRNTNHPGKAPQGEPVE